MRVISSDQSIVTETRTLSYRVDEATGNCLIMTAEGYGLEVFENHGQARERMAEVFGATKTGRGWFDFSE